MNIHDYYPTIIICVIIALFICIFHASCYCILHLFYPPICIGTFSNFLTSIISFGTLLVALFSALYVKKEYDKHIEEERTKLLCEYNHRYSVDKHIECVIEWMLQIAIMDESGNIIGVNRQIKNIPPNIHQKEMFMRFFEELQLQIEKRKLNKQDVKKLFSYYALVFDKIEEYHCDITDYNKIEWETFRNFVKQMNDK